jgi:chromate reductase
MPDLEILGISGSLRASSHNTALLRAAVQIAAGRGMNVSVYDRLRDIPPYDEDLDTGTPPEAVAGLRARIRAADGVLISTPEYNYGVPGVLKNAIDWASRPAATSALLRKPVAIMGAAPTNFGSVRAQHALRQSFLWIDSIVVGKPEVAVFRSHERFDEQGNLIDGTTRSLVSELLGALAETVWAQRERAAA